MKIYYLFLVRYNTQYLIRRPDQPKRAVGYPTPCLSCQLKSILLLTIYICLRWLPIWLVYLWPLFKSKESVCRFFMGLYAWLYLFKEPTKKWVESLVQVQDQCRGSLQTLNHDMHSNPNTIFFTNIVDTTIKHVARAKKCTETCSKMYINKRNLGLHIMNGYTFFKFSKKGKK